MRWLEKEMATHSSILAWKNPWTEESGGLNSMGLHDWAGVHEGGGRWVGSNKLVELKKKKKKKIWLNTNKKYHGGTFPGHPHVGWWSKSQKNLKITAVIHFWCKFSALVTSFSYHPFFPPPLHKVDKEELDKKWFLISHLLLSPPHLPCVLWEYRELPSSLPSPLLSSFSGLPWWLSGKEFACDAGDPGSIPGLGRSLREGNGYPLQYSCLENLMDREA